MESDILYEEVQFFAKKSVQDLFKIITGLLILGSAVSLFIKPQEQTEIVNSLLAGVLICGFVSFVLAKAKLITQVRANGIYVRFPPLQNRFVVCTWDAMDTVFIRNYNSLQEFGGWGIRFGPNGTVYNVSGNIGIQIVFKDGNRLLIGTNDPEQLGDILLRMGRLDYQNT